MRRFLLLPLALLFFVNGCSSEVQSDEPEIKTETLQVTATAYNSVPSQTTAENPALAAWGDTLKPGMKAIAVSRDLIPIGLTHGTRVKIEGLEGTYVVRDKMHSRWEEKIDIYMGKDIDAAREWGKKKVEITWLSPSGDEY